MPVGMTAVSLTADTAEELRKFAANATGVVGRRVTLDVAVRLALRLATVPVSQCDDVVGETFDAITEG